MDPLESALIGIQYLDGRVEYIVCKYDGYEARDILCHMKRPDVLELIKMGNVECKACLACPELRDEYTPAELVIDQHEFYHIGRYHYYYLFTMDDTWFITTGHQWI